MKGFMSIYIPTKPYIKAYVLNKLGPTPLLNTQNETIGNKLHDLLQHNNNERASRYNNGMYSAMMRIYIPINTFSLNFWLIVNYLFRN